MPKKREKFREEPRHKFPCALLPCLRFPSCFLSLHYTLQQWKFKIGQFLCSFLVRRRLGFPRLRFWVFPFKHRNTRPSSSLLVNLVFSFVFLFFVFTLSSSLMAIVFVCFRECVPVRRRSSRKLSQTPYPCRPSQRKYKNTTSLRYSIRLGRHRRCPVRPDVLHSHIQRTRKRDNTHFTHTYCTARVRNSGQLFGSIAAPVSRQCLSALTLLNVNVFLFFFWFFHFLFFFCFSDYIHATAAAFGKASGFLSSLKVRATPWMLNALPEPSFSLKARPPQFFLFFFFFLLFR